MDLFLSLQPALKNLLASTEAEAQNTEQPPKFVAEPRAAGSKPDAYADAHSVAIAKRQLITDRFAIGIGL